MQQTDENLNGGGAFSLLLSDDDEAIDRLAHEAVQDALREHKRLGQSVVIWRDGQIVTLAPEDIPLDDEPEAAKVA